MGVGRSVSPAGSGDGVACQQDIGTGWRRRTHSYSPHDHGLLLYVPLLSTGTATLQSGQAPVATATIAFAVGASYQPWAPAIHRWRTRGAKAE